MSRQLWGYSSIGLAAVAFAGAIAVEMLTIQQGTMEAVTAQWEARVADLKQSNEAKAATYKAVITKEQAENAAIKQKGEADLAVAQSEIARASSVYAVEQANADAARLEAEATQLRPKVAQLRTQLQKCYRPCHNKYPGKAGSSLDTSENFFGCINYCFMDLVNGSR